MAHVPLLHAAVPFATEQAIPHAPQLLVVRMSVSQPLAMLPSQFAVPAGHVVIAHVPALQAETAPPIVAHDVQLAPHSRVESFAAQWSPQR